MFRLLLLALPLAGALARPAAAQSATGLPARPVPFQFVTDQAKLLAPADAKKLDGGLRRYADQTGTQVVVVTVPNLGGRQVSDYGRALGTAWGVGQRGKNNGLVVIVAAQEHKVTIQPGSGLVDKITPALTQRVIAQDFGPNFKQNNYFAGLRKGLSTLMLAANPASNPNKTAAPAAAGAPSTAPDAAAGAPSAAAPALSSEAPGAAPDAGNMATNGGGGLLAMPASSEPTGPGFGTLALGALGIVVVIWLLIKLFRRKSADSAPSPNNPNFYPNQPNPNQPNRPGGTPNFLPNGPQGGGYGPGPANYGGQAPNQGGGLGMGSILATGAAAAAGAYLGNRMSEGHNGGSGSAHNFDTNNAGFGGGAAAAGGAAAGAAGTGAAGDYFAGRGAEANESAPDYFSDDNTGNDQSGDYFSSDNSSYDDTSSDDTGGGGFDDTSNDNSGSW
ncbi:TPM domain-containing protein [Hymenobacter nivis]|uniref:TPM domain-containing protein n=1 Tax=Hymenobacter nivis TaxID=1850093 RepID=UPI0013763648|nr:TPM domain-containing protein [Hymenobacter nivis]